MKIVKLIMRVLVAVALVTVLGIASINVYMILSTQKHIVSEEEARSIEADCIVVLGAAVRADGSPSLMLRDRLDKGVSLQSSGVTKKMLMSGDNRRVDYNEVKVMREYAIASGVADGNVTMDHAGFSTYETMYRLKSVFMAKKAIVVTQKYHLYRAVYNAEKLGVDVVGVAAAEKTYKGQMAREIREVFARVKDFYYVHAGKLPTYLGDPVPL